MRTRGALVIYTPQLTKTIRVWSQLTFWELRHLYARKSLSEIYSACFKKKKGGSNKNQDEGTAFLPHKQEFTCYKCHLLEKACFVLGSETTREDHGHI